MLIVGPEPCSKKPYLSRELLKSKVNCPSCGSQLTLRTLRYKHTCSNKMPVDVAARRATMLARALEAHGHRTGPKEMVDA